MLRTLVSGVALAAAALGLAPETEDNVLVLTEDNFANTIAEHEHVLVEFYAPWCGHCKNLAPEYAEAAGFFEASEDFNNVKLAKVDATENKALATKYEVSGYPTLIWFKNGEDSEYTGGRTADTIKAWISKKTGPAAVVVEDAAALEALTANEDDNVVVVLAASDITEANANAKTFLKFAGATEDAVFALTSDFSLVDLEAGEDRVVLLKNYDEKRAELDTITAEGLKALVQDHLLPYVVEFSDKVAPKIFGGNIREHLLVFRDASADADAEFVEVVRSVAKKNVGKYLFVTVDTSVSSNDRISEFFGLTKFPAARMIDISQGNPIKYSTNDEFDFSADHFEAFIASYAAKELKPHLNSDDIPENWDEDEVKIVVGKNFDDVVLDENKNVLLMAHAPWCGHCKSLMPVWSELAAAFEDNESVVIAKMDATSNEVTAFSPRGFPTLKFFPAGKPMIDFDGGRTLEELKTFVEQNSVAVAEDDDTAHDEL